ncbi:unnamed protein product [Durusdinium trenchii]|uniref:HTH La-type RNA-binding domain-containing protein n=1 Tax=Durusdinium trenchii TaxID=1381693 RepID=A0ABP0P982_9DINO
MDATDGAAGKAKAKRQWKKIDPGQILDIQSYEEQRKGSEVKGKGKGNEKGKGRGNGKGMSENGEGKGKGKGGKHASREEDPNVESTDPSGDLRPRPPREGAYGQPGLGSLGDPMAGGHQRQSYPRGGPSPKGGRRERDGKGKGRRSKGGFQSPQGASSFQAEEPQNAQVATPEARPSQAPSQVAPGTAHMAGGPFHAAVGKGGAGMGGFMPAPMQEGAMSFQMPQMQMFPPYMAGMGGMPYMGYAPEMMPCMSSTAATASPQRNDLVTKAKSQIEYYFSVGNLVKDIHLRKNVMDTQGWVSFSGLIQFPKLAQLTGDPTIILDAIHALPQLEMKPDNSAVRLKDNWQKWVWQQGD